MFIKDADGQPDEVHRVRPRKVQSTGAAVPMEMGCVTCLSYLPIQKLIRSPYSRVFIDLNMQHTPPSQMLAGGFSGDQPHLKAI